MVEAQEETRSGFPLLGKIASGQVALGMATRSGPSYVRHFAAAGMDFLIADMMHGPMGWPEMAHIAALARSDGVYPFARIQGHPWGSGSGVLDRGFAADAMKAITSGAEGIVWSVATAAEAESVAHLIDDWHQGKPVVTPADVESIEREVAATRLLLPLIETPSALAELDRILAADGIGGVWMGMTDLSHQLGHAHENDHPDVMRALSEAVRIAEKHHKVVLANVGYIFDSIDAQIANAVQLADAGASLVMLATTEFHVHIAARALVSGVSGAVAGGRAGT
jgi:4-hydroxy-2-oxoheptanedioate aldolase